MKLNKALWKKRGAFADDSKLLEFLSKRKWRLVFKSKKGKVGGESKPFNFYFGRGKLANKVPIKTDIIRTMVAKTVTLKSGIYEIEMSIGPDPNDYHLNTKFLVAPSEVITDSLTIGVDN